MRAGGGRRKSGEDVESQGDGFRWDTRRTEARRRTEQKERRSKLVDVALASARAISTGSSVQGFEARSLGVLRTGQGVRETEVHSSRLGLALAPASGGDGRTWQELRCKRQEPRSHPRCAASLPISIPSCLRQHLTSALAPPARSCRYSLPALCRYVRFRWAVSVGYLARSTAC